MDQVLVAVAAVAVTVGLLGGVMAVALLILAAARRVSPWHSAAFAVSGLVWGLVAMAALALAK